MPSERPLWYKTAVFARLHVRALQDANGDGIGDFGADQSTRLPQELGVDCLSSFPSAPLPLRDGYDVSDHRAVHPDYGTTADFERFLERPMLRPRGSSPTS